MLHILWPAIQHEQCEQIRNTLATDLTLLHNRRVKSQNSPSSNQALAHSIGSDVATSVKRIELGRARVIARAWSETLAEHHRTNQAALFARVAMESFAFEVAPTLTLSAPFVALQGTLDSTAVQLSKAMGREAAALPVIEGCHFLTSLYTTLLSSKERGTLGAFYTPPALTKRLLDLAEEGGTDWATARVLDPASGGGAFLLEAAVRMCSTLEGSEPAFILAQIGTRLQGLELDPNAAALSQAALEILLSDLSVASGRAVPICVKVGNTLEESPLEQFDLVVGNPPYGRVALTSAQRERFARSLYGHANLYGIFTDIALRWTRPGGLIAYLTPTSMLGGQYFMALRQLLAKAAPPVAIDFVHARRGVFEDVLQETLLALYRKGGRQERFQVHYLHIDDEREARLTKNGKVQLPDDSGAPWLAPREPAHVGLIRAAEAMPTRLSDWGYEVSTGPLVWNRFKPQMRDRAARGLYPLIWAEAVTADGQFIFRAEKRNHAPYFKAEVGDEWLVVDKSCVLVQRTTAKEQVRRLIATELPQHFIDTHGGVIIENHLNMVRAQGEAKISPKTVAAVLNSNVIDQVFRCISGSVAVSAFEMESMPLPSVAAMEPIEHLIAQGAAIADVERALRSLYGIRS